MPRYRFRWELLPAALIRRIARELQLDGVSAAALRKAYGTRPGDDFVRDAWPLLRDEWLAKDGPARRSVVTLLRERKSRSSRVAECTYPAAGKVHMPSRGTGRGLSNSTARPRSGGWRAAGGPVEGRPDEAPTRPAKPSYRQTY